VIFSLSSGGKFKKSILTLGVGEGNELSVISVAT